MPRAWCGVAWWQLHESCTGLPHAPGICFWILALILPGLVILSDRQGRRIPASRGRSSRPLKESLALSKILPPNAPQEGLPDARRYIALQNAVRQRAPTREAGLEITVPSKAKDQRPDDNVFVISRFCLILGFCHLIILEYPRFAIALRYHFSTNRWSSQLRPSGRNIQVRKPKAGISAKNPI